MRFQQPTCLRIATLRALIIVAGLAFVFMPATKASSDDLKITGLTDAAGRADPKIGLNEDLVVKLSGPVDPARYTLLLDGREIAGLKDTRYDSTKPALIFRLRRTSDNADAWNGLLGSPTAMTRQVTVSLKQKPMPPATEPAIISNTPEPHFEFVIISGVWLFFALAAVAGVLILVWGSAKRTTILKDNLLPQVASNKQPYSLGRWQMAFWFTLVFASFVFLFVLLWDYNTVTEQALTLMGISAATALFAVAVDAAKETPIGAANNKLRTLGLNTYADVQKIQQEIDDRTAQLANKVAPPDPSTAQKLLTEIADRKALLRTYQDTVAPFLSGGWYRDLTTEANGPALHRLQVLCWTVILGIVFVIGVYRNFAMPQFSGTLLALMGISSAGYVGFKYPEKQS